MLIDNCRRCTINSRVQKGGSMSPTPDLKRATAPPTRTEHRAHGRYHQGRAPGGPHWRAPPLERQSRTARVGSGWENAGGVLRDVPEPLRRSIVLIVDDDLGFVCWLGDILAEAGYQSVPASDSRE